uniref:Uncharacterized protein n=1 Tax=Marmota marmota marmota TaxID=9994 RepID=A0A8C5Z5F6_MARMA
SRRSPRRQSRGPGRGRCASAGSSSRSRSRHSTWGSASTGPQRPGTPARCPALPSSPGAAARGIAESNPRAGEAPSPCSGLGNPYLSPYSPLPTGKRRPQWYRAATELPDQREDTLWRQRSEKSVNRRSRKITDPFAAGDR